MVKQIIRKGWIVIICLSFFVFRFEIVMSGSMEPMIHTGSLAVIVRNVPSIEMGDIILYQKDDLLILHRVIDQSKDSYITKGDANDSSDLSPVELSQVKGKYIFNIPYLGYFLFYVKKYIFIVLLLIIVLWRKKDENKTNNG